MSEINRYGFSAGAALQTASGYFPEGQAPSTLNDAARQVMADVRKEYQCRSGELTATYSAGTYSVTFEREISSGELQGVFAVIAEAANISGSAKVNINALGAKDLKTPYGHLQASDIPAQSVMVFTYNKLADNFTLLSRTVRDSRPDAARLATGTYSGNGALSLAITGVGFTPKRLRVRNRRTVAAGTITTVETSDVIVDDNGSGGAILLDATGAGTFETGRIVSLDADGFTVGDGGGDGHPNTAGVLYNWEAEG